MKTIDLVTNPLTANQLLESARRQSIVVKSTNGDVFVVSAADELQAEGELLWQNHQFLVTVDLYQQEQSAVPLEEVEARFR